MQLFLQNRLSGGAFPTITGRGRTTVFSLFADLVTLQETWNVDTAEDKSSQKSQQKNGLKPALFWPFFSLPSRTVGTRFPAAISHRVQQSMASYALKIQPWMPLQLGKYHAEFAQLMSRNTGKNRVGDGVGEKTNRYASKGTLLQLGGVWLSFHLMEEICLAK